MSFTEFFAQASSKIELKPSDVNLSNPATANNDTLQQALGLVYFIAGIICVIIIIIGGIRYTSSQGDSSGINSAKNTILYAVVGLIVILLAAAITQLIFERL